MVKEYKSRVMWIENFQAYIIHTATVYNKSNNLFLRQSLASFNQMCMCMPCKSETCLMSLFNMIRSYGHLHAKTHRHMAVMGLIH